MGSVIQQPFLFLEYDIEQAFKTSSSAEILNLFIYFNSKKLDGFQEDLNELHKSKRMQRAVEKLMKHEHPWVREAANYYLVNFGIFKE